MGEVTKAAVRARLVEANPFASATEIALCADAYADYAAAQANIDEHGTIVFHPRTGAPIENPYLAIRSRAAALLLKVGLDPGGLWDG